MKNLKIQLSIAAIAAGALSMAIVAGNNNNSTKITNPSSAGYTSAATPQAPMAVREATSCEKVWVEATSTHVASCNGGAGNCKGCNTPHIMDFVAVVNNGDPNTIISFMEDYQAEFLADMPASIYYGAVNGSLSVSLYDGPTGGPQYVLFKDANGLVAMAYEM